MLGEFGPAKSAVSITKAAHLQRTKSSVIVRFSDATGVPTIPDADGNAFSKCIAIRFILPDSTTTDIVSISTNGFPAATPEDFLCLLNVLAASGADGTKPAQKPAPIETFIGMHSAAKAFVTMPKLPPVSFATNGFYGVNTFKFINAKGETQYCRYRNMPAKGQQFLSAEVAKKLRLIICLKIYQKAWKKTVQYKLTDQLADKTDNVNDATAVLPDSRKLVLPGILTLKTVAADGVNFEKATMFNPLGLVDGIEASEDPIPLARPVAYAVSYGRRLG